MNKQPLNQQITIYFFQCIAVQSRFSAFIFVLEGYSSSCIIINERGTSEGGYTKPSEGRTLSQVKFPNFEKKKYLRFPPWESI